MEADTANRYRSRILREMNANRDNPFNSPPSSTGSHGSVTLSSVFSDPDGESTRKLNEDIARVTAPRKLPVNFEAAHRKWPEFYSMPKKSSAPIFEDDRRLASLESKENKPPVFAFNNNDDSTQDPWQGSIRTRSEMQPRVDSESDLSSILDKSPARGLSTQAYSKNTRNPSPLAKVHTNRHSSQEYDQRRSSLNDALDQLRKSSKNMEDGNRHNKSPHMSSAKSSLTAVPSSPENGDHNASHIRSFFMPDVSHLNDFVTGTLRFNGSMKNGVPIFVKRGQVFDRRERSAQPLHAEVDGLEVPADEEKIFVSMDMIREEIVSLQDHYDKVQEYASNLQQQVESLEEQLKSRPSAGGRSNSDHLNAHLQEQKDRLEVEVASLQSRLEQASRKISINEIENDSLTQEKDRAVRKLQEACEDINKLTRKLSSKEKELETSHKQLGSTDQMRQDNDMLRREVVNLKHGRDALELENSSLRTENDDLNQQLGELQKQTESLTTNNKAMQKQQQSLVSENRTLRSSNQVLSNENDELRHNFDNAQQDLDLVREEANNLREDLGVPEEDLEALREDNQSLVRHNEKYYNDNKTLRKENAGFERSVHDLQGDKRKLQQEIATLNEQLDHCRPIPKDDFSARLDEETDENMTSAFFIPDITMNTNETGPVEGTETKELPTLPELTAHSKRLSTIVDMTEEQTQKSVKNASTHSRKGSQQMRNASKASKASSGGKVAFAMPETSIKMSKSTSNLANQGTKRRTSSQSVSHKRASLPNLNDDNEDTTGFLSENNTTQDYLVPLPKIMKSRKETKADQKQSSRDVTSQSLKSQHIRPQSRAPNRHASTDVTHETSRSAQRETCPALTNEARRVLDDLCEHNCRNCTVCSRISSHRGMVSAIDFANGKKRVTVSRPTPVTDRDLTTEDPTMRPAHSPGHALAMVIKGLEDESQHLQLELTRLQTQYSESDKALGRRDRLSMADSIRTLLKQLEAKNDQIYSLYDVLEGQKAAGQAMTEEEVEMTVLNITGMTVRDVTGEQLTWEGIVDS